DLDRERAVIAQEMVRTLSEPLDALLLRLASEAMTGPYARPSVGTPQDLASLKPEVLLATHKRYYAAADLLLVVVGDCKAALVKEVAAKDFAAVPGGPPPSATPSETAWKTRGEPVKIQIRGERSYCMVGFPAPPFKERQDVLAMDVVTALLDQGPRGRLDVALSNLGGGPESDVSFLTTRWPGMVSLGVGVANAQYSQAKDALLGVVREFLAADIPEAEIAQAKTRLISTYLFDSETFGGQAYSLGFYETLGDYQFGEGYLKGISAVTAADIRRVARKYLDLSQAVTLEAQPAPPPPAPDTGETHV
ncbi:MAG TPA: pitrilysin family protein, partial [Armatimonadota bacterium]